MPYAARKPSVSAPRPNFCARSAPATAAEPLTASTESPVARPLLRALRRTEGLLCRLLAGTAHELKQTRQTRLALDRGVARRAAGRVRRGLRRQDRARHRGRRVHGLAPDRGARRARGARARLRARDF